MNPLVLENEPTLTVRNNPRKIPHHIAIIMDGNRRWGKLRKLPSIVGHWKGAETLKKIVTEASTMGIKIMTVYSFSTENWNRSKEEIYTLMSICQTYLENEREAMIRNGVRLDVIGDINRLPHSVLESLTRTRSATAHCDTINLILALNYGGRDDIRRAFLSLMEDVQCGKIAKEDISEHLISQYLDTAKWPDPELIIRTSGELRQSNFLLWQSSYSEFYHTDVLWPDFDADELKKAIDHYQKREQRLGL
jgi:undecaprenyl diphosphate synthase